MIAKFVGGVDEGGVVGAVVHGEAEVWDVWGVEGELKEGEGVMGVGADGWRLELMDVADDDDLFCTQEGWECVSGVELGGLVDDDGVELIELVREEFRQGMWGGHDEGFKGLDEGGVEVEECAGGGG